MRLWIALLIILMVFLYVWTHIDIINRGYEIEGLLTRKKELEKANMFLTIEISSLTSLDRIEKRAKNEFGLSKPEPGQVITVKSNRSAKGECIAC